MTVRLVGGCNVHITVFAGFFLGLVTPAAGDDKVCIAVGASLSAIAAQVERNDGVLCQSATLHEQNLEVGRHSQQLTQIGLGLRVDGLEFLAAMAHFHHTHTAMTAVGVRPVQHFGCGLGQYFRGDGGWAC